MLAFGTARKEREPKKSRNIIVTLRVTLLCPTLPTFVRVFARLPQQQERGGRFQLVPVQFTCSPSTRKTIHEQPHCVLGLFSLCFLAQDFPPGLCEAASQLRACDRTEERFSIERLNPQRSKQGGVCLLLSLLSLVSALLPHSSSFSSSRSFRGTRARHAPLYTVFCLPVYKSCGRVRVDFCSNHGPHAIRLPLPSLSLLLLTSSRRHLCCADTQSLTFPSQPQPQTRARQAMLRALIFSALVALVRSRSSLPPPPPPFALVLV